MTKSQRIKQLRKDIKLIEDILEVNNEWTAPKIAVAKYVFLTTMLHATDEITYQICNMSGRDVTEELRNTLELLTSGKES